MLRWFDGFEHYGVKARMLEGVGGAAAWSQVSGNWALSTADPATGSYHMRMTADGHCVALEGTTGKHTACGIYALRPGVWPHFCQRASAMIPT